MAPVTGSLILLILCCAGALADNHEKPPRDKPGKCPPGPVAKCSLPLPRGDCKVDQNCGGDKKCCMDLCTPRCKKPVPDVKPGTCPPPRTRCPGPPKHGKCKVDRDCKGGDKCCEKDCVLECMNLKTTKDKPGHCPTFNTFVACKTPYTHVACRADHECSGDNKCCDYDCQMQCKKPQ